MRDPERLSLFVSTYSIHKSFFPFAVHITFGILFDLFSFKKSSIEEGQDEKNEGSRKRCGGKLMCVRGHPFFPAVLFRRYSEDRNAGTVMVTSNAVRQYMASWLTQYNREFSWSPEPRVLLPPLLSFFLSFPLSSLFLFPLPLSFPKRRARVFNLVLLSLSVCAESACTRDIRG